MPSSLEILNLSNNHIENLDTEALQGLRNLTTLDLSENQLRSLSGVEHLRRLKRLLLQGNQLASTEPLTGSTSLVEIDLENNPALSDWGSFLHSIVASKDMLYVNIRATGLLTKQGLVISNHEQLCEEIAQKFSEEDPTASLNILKTTLKFYLNGSLYRSKRVYNKIRAALRQPKRTSGAFSNGSSSYGAQQFTPGMQRPSSVIRRPAQTYFQKDLNSKSSDSHSGLRTGHAGNITATAGVHSPFMQSQRCEDLEYLYDEILDEEEKQSRLQRKR